jgi:bifunctional DNA-binding transcriptional regulator/antitoxin component of YhaV-PrlF toxin-antitoxin module
LLNAEKGLGITLGARKRKEKMSSVRVLSRVDEKEKITFPGNTSHEAGLKPGQLVELKIVGASTRRMVLVSAKR